MDSFMRMQMGMLGPSAHMKISGVVHDSDPKVELVALLSPRVAHAVHALMAKSEMGGGDAYGPFTAAEVCEYDASWEALSPRHTAAALRWAQKLGLAIFVPPGFWTPSFVALDCRRAFEERFLRDEEAENG